MSSTAWQQFEADSIAKATACALVFSSGIAGWVEFVPEYIDLTTTPTRKRILSLVNQLVDGNMSAVGVAAWPAGNSSIRTKVPSTRPGASVGEQALHIERNGVNCPFTIQSVCTIGHRYLARGWALPSAAGYPYIASGAGTTFWTGQAVPVWQQYQFEFVASAVGFQLLSSTTVGSNYVEFSPIELIDQGLTPQRKLAVIPAVPGVSGNMYRKRSDDLVGLWDERGHTDYSEWTDQSGRGNNLYQAIAGNRFAAGPLIKGLATMLGADTKYMISSARDLRAESGFLICCVCRVDANPVGVSASVCGVGSGAGFGFMFSRDTATQTSATMVKTDAGLSYPAIGATAAGDLIALATRFDGTGAQSYRNLVVGSAVVPAYGNITFTGCNFIAGNESRLVVNQYHIGPICEIRLYANRKTNAFALQVQAELIAKWL